MLEGITMVDYGTRWTQQRSFGVFAFRKLGASTKSYEDAINVCVKNIVYVMLEMHVYLIFYSYLGGSSAFNKSHVSTAKTHNEN